MPLKLNKLEDDIVQANIDRNKMRIGRFQTAEPASKMQSNPVHYARQYAGAALELGLELYQQEGALAEIRKYLSLAGTLTFTMLSSKQFEGHSTPLEFETALALAVCFCPASLYQNPDEIRFEQFFSAPESLEFFAILARYLDLLRRFIAPGVLDGETWSKLESECRKSNAGRYDAKVTLAKLQATKALADKDAAFLNQSITTLIEDHENEAKRGENQRSERGFICLPGLMFAHLGSKQGLNCTVKSPYLPLQLPS